ncbi:MAG: hypothetical protein R3E79_09375 [Caldilineaceae bacterium]
MALQQWQRPGPPPAKSRRALVQQDPDVQAICPSSLWQENFAKYGKTDVPHKAFIEIQTAWEAAIGAAMSNTTPLAQALEEGNTTIQAILDRG